MERMEQIGRVGVRERYCERRCEDWRGVGRVRSLAIPGLFGGDDCLLGGELVGCRASGLAPESGSGLLQSKAFGGLVLGCGCAGGSAQPATGGMWVEHGSGIR